MLCALAGGGNVAGEGMLFVFQTVRGQELAKCLETWVVLTGELCKRGCGKRGDLAFGVERRMCSL